MDGGITALAGQVLLAGLAIAVAAGLIGFSAKIGNAIADILIVFLRQRLSSRQPVSLRQVRVSRAESSASCSVAAHHHVTGRNGNVVQASCIHGDVTFRQPKTSKNSRKRPRIAGHARDDGTSPPGVRLIWAMTCYEQRPSAVAGLVEFELVAA